jgi:hypothetical protein
LFGQTDFDELLKSQFLLAVAGWLLLLAAAVGLHLLQTLA